jgi:hypothetical protein
MYVCHGLLLLLTIRRRVEHLSKAILAHFSVQRLTSYSRIPLWEWNSEQSSGTTSSKRGNNTLKIARERPWGSIALDYSSTTTSITARQGLCIGGFHPNYTFFLSRPSSFSTILLLRSIRGWSGLDFECLVIVWIVELCKAPWVSEQLLCRASPTLSHASSRLSFMFS